MRSGRTFSIAIGMMGCISGDQAPQSGLDPLKNKTLTISLNSISSYGGFIGFPFPKCGGQDESSFPFNSLRRHKEKVLDWKGRGNGGNEKK